PTDLRGRAAGGGRLPIPCAATHVGEGVDRGRLGKNRREPPRALLPDHAPRVEPSGAGTRQVSPGGYRDRADPGPGIAPLLEEFDMSMRDLTRRIKYLLHREEFADDLDEELRLHLELRASRLRERGMN